jgi:hypothetical protein
MSPRKTVDALMTYVLPRPWIVMALVLLLVFIVMLFGCTSTRDGGQVLKLPNCRVSSSGQVSCTTSGMSIPLP